MVSTYRSVTRIPSITEQACDGTPLKVHRKACIWGLVEYYRLVSTAPKYLADTDIKAFQQAVFTCLLNWSALYSAAVAAGSGAWRPLPKLHMWYCAKPNGVSW